MVRMVGWLCLEWTSVFGVQMCLECKCVWSENVFGVDKCDWSGQV